MAVELFSLNKSWSRRKRTRTAGGERGEEGKRDRDLKPEITKTLSSRSITVDPITHASCDIVW